MPYPVLIVDITLCRLSLFRIISSVLKIDTLSAKPLLIYQDSACSCVCVLSRDSSVRCLPKRTPRPDPTCARTYGLRVYNLVHLRVPAPFLLTTGQQLNCLVFQNLFKPFFEVLMHFIKSKHVFDHHHECPNRWCSARLSSIHRFYCLIMILSLKQAILILFTPMLIILLCITLPVFSTSEKPNRNCATKRQRLKNTKHFKPYYSF